MGRYIVKRIGYMLLVLVILSFLMFIIYNMVPSNRAYTDAKAEIQTMKKACPPRTWTPVFRNYT